MNNVDILNLDIPTNTFPLYLSDQGQLTIPQVVRDSLLVKTGDMFVLFQIGDLLMIVPKQLRVPQLADPYTTNHCSRPAID